MEKKLKIHNFTMQFEESLSKYLCWRTSNYSEIEESSEVLEYIITKEKYQQVLFSLLFGTDKFIREHDERLVKCYQNLDFIEPRHLDIAPSLTEDRLISVAGNRMI